MSNLSRRSLVASAAALPALAVPAVALTITAEPDPVLAAIEHFEEALAVEVAGYEARGNAQEAFRDRHDCLHPSGLIREAAEILKKVPGNEGKNLYYSLRTHAQITELKDGALAEHVPFFHRTLNIQTDDYAKNVAPLDEACDRAYLKRYDAMQAVFEIVPTTLAGMRAKIDFAVSADHVMGPLSEDETLHDFLNTLYKSASLLAVQS